MTSQILALFSFTAFATPSPGSMVVKLGSQCDGTTPIPSILQTSMPANPIFPLDINGSPWGWQPATVGANPGWTPDQLSAIREGYAQWSTNTTIGAINGLMSWEFTELPAVTYTSINDVICNGQSDIVLLDSADFSLVCPSQFGIACTHTEFQLGVTSIVDSFDIYVNVGLTSTGLSQSYDPIAHPLTAVVTHEVGHGLGFRHDEFWNDEGDFPHTMDKHPDWTNIQTWWNMAAVEALTLPQPECIGYHLLS